MERVAEPEVRPMIAVHFGDGAEGYAVAFDGAVIECVVSVPQAPGRPVEVVLQLGDGAMTLRTRSRGSRRVDDGRFQVNLRPVALRREERTRLEATFAAK